MSSVSVIIPAYQHGLTIASTIDSVLMQTKQPDQIIVVNDGSTDNTNQVLEKYYDKIILINQNNQGGNPARNRGFQEAKGDYVIFCDADVKMQPKMLEKMSYILDNNPEISFVYSGFKFGWKQFSSFPFDRGRLRKMNYVHTTSLVRCDHFPGFDNQIKRLQDWDVWLTMAEQNRKGFLITEELFQILDDSDRIGISQWRPSFMYKIPWKKIGWFPKSMKKYFDARQIIAEKHRL